MASSKLEASSYQIRKICCIGGGYVGGPTSSVIAYKNPSLIVSVVDLDKERICAWNTDDLPVTEPDLLEIVQIARDGTNERKPNLFFSSDIEQAIQSADLIFIAVNTPTTSTGALSTTHVESAVETIARTSISHKIIVEKSTVPCGTARKLRKILAYHGRPGIHFDMLSNPEFLAEGSAVRDLLMPDRVLIGSEPDDQGSQAMRALRQIYLGWVPQDRIIAMNIKSAELAKLAANVLLAQRLSSINALSIICEETGADVEEIAFTCGLDSRIGPKMLQASLGFGGSCLTKDILAMANLSHTLGLSEVSSYWESINDINEYRKSKFTETIHKRLGHSIGGKRIAVLGFAFKKGTDDVRESPAIDLIAKLIMGGARVAVYDPRAREADLVKALTRKIGPGILVLPSRLEACRSAYAACIHAHVLVVATDWDEFSNRKSVGRVRDIGKMFGHDGNAVNDAKRMPFSPDSDKESNGATISATSLGSEKGDYRARLDWAKIAEGMKEPKLVFDGCNAIDRQKLVALGFDVEAVGKASLP